MGKTNWQTWLMGIGLTAGLLGCATTAPEQVQVIDTAPAPRLELSDDRFTLVAVPTPEEIFRLSEEQEQHFLDYYHDPVNQDTPGHKRLYAYLESLLHGFHFRGHTYAAETALSEQSGNCLSLAIVTTALARLVDMKVTYQRVNSAPVYHRYHNVMTLSSHVRTHLYDPDFEPDENMIAFIKPKLIVDYFPASGNVGGNTVSEAEFIAMFYQNLAGDALVKQQYDRVYSLLNAALELGEDNPETLNTLGVLFKQLGDEREAEHLYEFAIRHTQGSVNIISNYVLLLEEQGRTAEAETLQQEIEGVEDDNPYRWFDVANRQFKKSNFAIALKYFKKALEVAPYLHEGHFGLAKTYHQIGLPKQANRHLQKALELSYVPQDQKLYRAKLRILQGSD